MEKKIAENKNRDPYIYTAVLIIFIFFILVIFVVKKLNIIDGVPITGHAVLDTGTLNPGYALVILIVISIYAIITCSYLGRKSRG